MKPLADGGAIITARPPGQTKERALAAATQAKYEKVPVTRGVIARFPRALREIAKVSVVGTKKHQVPLDDMSFVDIPDAYNVYTDAVGRHLTGEYIDGPINDEDGGLLHAAQLAWDALARLEVLLVEMERGERG